MGIEENVRDAGRRGEEEREGEMRNEKRGREGRGGPGS